LAGQADLVALGTVCIGLDYSSPVYSRSLRSLPAERAGGRRGEADAEISVSWAREVTLLSPLLPSPGVDSSGGVGRALVDLVAQVDL
jgi:hypothetical protein